MIAAPNSTDSGSHLSRFQPDPEQRRCLNVVAGHLLDLLPRRSDRQLNQSQEHSASITGIAGAPGCGKSTLAAVLCDRLNAAGIPAMCLALDDYYLDRREREQLARDCHPLLATRGVPGTHDLERLVHDLVALKKGDIAGLRLPRFDKSTDSSTPVGTWPCVETPPRHIFLEGWCVGARAQSDSELDVPVSEFEWRYDPEAAWRKQVNGFVKVYQRRLWPMLDRLWYLATPDWERVVDWRWQQEQHGGSSLLKNREAVEDFLATYKRIVRHMLDTHTQWADVSLYADNHHRLRLDNEGGQ